MKKKKIQKKQKNLSYHVGNFLIITSLFLLFIIFTPVISTYLFPPKIKSQNELNGSFITIPKINAQAPLKMDVDPFNEKVYQEVLKTGVAQAKGTAKPGERGSIFVFAHSSGNPLEITRYNTIFLRLGELNKNDQIIIKKDGKEFKYKVFDKKVVSPSEIKYLKETKDQLIIQTCWPIGTSFKRLLIFASSTN